MAQSRSWLIINDNRVPGTSASGHSGESRTVKLVPAHAPFLKTASSLPTGYHLSVLHYICSTNEPVRSSTAVPYPIPWEGVVDLVGVRPSSSFVPSPLWSSAEGTGREKGRMGWIDQSRHGQIQLESAVSILIGTGRSPQPVPVGRCAPRHCTVPPPPPPPPPPARILNTVPALPSWVPGAGHAKEPLYLEGD